MKRTTDKLRIKQLRPSDDVTRVRDLVNPPRDRPRSSRSSRPAKPAAIIYPFVSAARDDDRVHRETVSILRIWWERWRERRRFGRELPWMADEVLEDYGLTREQARRLCRRPFWRA
ncbi:DUF1127 domain-containing protein [Bradyrhizobium sp. HKCCYLS1011]|uniref:DUF1127 domain-containing protein n=1 Tax=Bradyrhizobium sp. HKCCYLS1011 TaxID=3420733 RepID=UPI003EC0F0BC